MKPLQVNSNANPTVMYGMVKQETLKTINRCLKYKRVPYKLLTNIVKDSDALQFVEDIKQGLKGTRFRLRAFGRNPQRKQFGLPREDGYLPLNVSTRISLFLNWKPGMREKFQH